MSHFLTKFQSPSSVQTVAIGAAGAAWVSQTSLHKHQLQTITWSEHATASQNIDAVLEQINLSRTCKVLWVVAPSLLKHWLQQAPEKIQSLNELHAITLQRAQQLFGASTSSGITLPHPGWIVSADWSITQAFLSSAMPTNWHAELQNHTKQLSQLDARTLNMAGSLTSPLRLIWSSYKNQLPINGWLAIAAANTMYLIYFKNNTCIYFRSLQLQGGANAEDIQHIALTEWQRDMLRTQHTSNQLHWLCLMPTEAVVKIASYHLMPLQRQSRNTSISPDFESDDLDAFSLDGRFALSEVRQTAWCALQCLES